MKRVENITKCVDINISLPDVLPKTNKKTNSPAFEVDTFKSFEHNHIKYKNHFYYENLDNNILFTDKIDMNDYFDMYNSIVDSDVGIISTEAFYVGEKNKKKSLKDLLKTNNQMKNKFQCLTKYSHSKGAKIFLKLRSIYGRCDLDHKALDLVSYSASFNIDYTYPILKTMRVSDSEVFRIIEEFGEYAKIAKNLGFDGVLIDASADCLLGEMCLPELNKRQFGHFSNTTNMLTKIINKVSQVANNLLIFCLITPKLFYTEIFQKMQKYINTIKKYPHFSKNNNINAFFNNFKQLKIDGVVFQFGSKENEFLHNYTQFMGDDIYTEFITQVIHNYNNYIIVSSLIDTKMSIKQNNLMFDITRKILADNNYIKKIKTQKPVKNCINCSYCNNISDNFLSIDCLINPDTFVKTLSQTKLTNTKVAVVGAGVSGMITAIILAKRGYSVDLFESNPKLNIRGILECIFDFDNDLKLYYQYLEKKLQTLVNKNKIRLNLQTTFNVNLDFNNYGGIVLATGFKEKFLNIQGAILKKVKNIYDALSDKNLVLSHKHIVIYAKTELSLKLALFLATAGKRIVVIIPDMCEILNLPNSHYTYYFYSLHELGAEVIINSYIKKIEDDFIDIVVDSKMYLKNFLSLALNIKNTNQRRGEKLTRSVDCDLLIYEPEKVSNNKLYYELVDNRYLGQLFMVGSAFQIGTLADDIKSAYFVAKNL